MPRSNTGISGPPGLRQILLTGVDPGDSVVVVWVSPAAPPSGTKRYGYIRIEREINPSLSVTVTGKSLWFQGDYLFLPFNVPGLIVTAFWLEAGIPWTVLSGTP